jgi:RNA polymerase sigma factor (sigma-70 family)
MVSHRDDIAELNEPEHGERELLMRMHDGDEQAFTELVTRYLDHATRFAYYLVRSQDAAEDIVQGVFVSIWEHRHMIDPNRPFKSYLFRSVRNRVYDERKASIIRDRYRG